MVCKPAANKTGRQKSKKNKTDFTYQRFKDHVRVVIVVDPSRCYLVQLKDYTDSIPVEL